VRRLDTLIDILIAALCVIAAFAVFVFGWQPPTEMVSLAAFSGCAGASLLRAARTTKEREP
jgi:small-conductance mechanosensitive channel